MNQSSCDQSIYQSLNQLSNKQPINCPTNPKKEMICIEYNLHLQMDKSHLKTRYPKHPRPVRRLVQIQHILNFRNYSPSLFNFIQFCPILSNFVQFCPILSNFVQFRPILSDFVKFWHILSHQL